MTDCIYDSNFGIAVRNAAVGQTEQLAEILRSDFVLGKGERERLALLIEGKLDREAGRPSFGPGAHHIEDAVTLYRNLLDAKEPEKSAAWLTAEYVGRKPSTIRQWNKDTLEREKLNKGYKEQYQSNT